MENYQTLRIEQLEPNSSVFNLILNRPTHSNALSLEFFSEFPKALFSLDSNPDAAVIILSGAGQHFCVGIELSTLKTLAQDFQSCESGRGGERLRRNIKWMQGAITAIEKCRKSVIAAVHGACAGGGVDIVTACDIRFCTAETYFCVKEVDLAITADLGTLQRLPAIVGYGNAMELALTGRTITGPQAKKLGLVSRVFASIEDMENGVRAIAKELAAKSPLAVTGTKAVLLRSKDMSVEQGLDYVATWNSSMLMSDDLKEATIAFVQNRKPDFTKL